ncbi:hypothetical protein JQX13_41500 [Archangium violaceum]|uniref:hypothetical protein n=1 Tax=Archangium violaceum TaxID=83451 RepID=UPI00193C55D0|nr:hypothetical protein [Archangium violaceum]QRK06507.1 hypothetical protein JQX13_41500 [Archangium violaceum]
MKALEMASVVLWLAACDEGAPPSFPGEEAPPSDAGPVIPVEVSWNGISPSVRSTPPLPPRVGRAEVLYVPEGTRGLSDVTAVEVRLRVSGLVGSVSVDAEFLAPGPAAYEKHTRMVEAVVPTEARELVFSLPVAGTNIPLHGLSGRWEARFFVDGSPLTAVSFTLER